MSLTDSKVSFLDAKSGGLQEVQINLSDYLEATENRMSLSQFYANKYPTSHESMSTFEQFMMSSGIRLRADKAHGIGATSLKHLFNGVSEFQFGTGIVRNTGADRQSVAGRILFPEILLQMTNETLAISKEDYLAPWEAAIAHKTSVVGPLVDQPLINVTAPEGSRSQAIAQLAEPNVMVTITTSSRGMKIPTKSVGLMVSDEALAITTLDLVGIIMSAQARGERIARLEQDMSNIISGDLDTGVTATSFVNASTFDSGIPTAPMTHKAWLKWLRANYTKMSITHVLGDLDSALTIDGRTGKPLATSDQTTKSQGMPVDYSIINANLPTPDFLILPTSIIGANRLVGFDKQFALHQITNVSATYSAVEEFVTRKAKVLRVDYGTILVKLMDEAFTGLTMAA